MTLRLDTRIRPHLPPGHEFEFIFGLDGRTFREQKNRRTFRATIGECRCFVKTHGPTSWREIVKNAARGRWPVLTSAAEHAAIERISSLGISTLTSLGYGVRGRAPARLESFIITEELAGHMHLSDLPPRLAHLPRRQRTRVTRRLIAAVASIARRMHAGGVNHRDFYLVHFMLPERDWSTWRGEDPGLRLIDLHRAQVRDRTPARWVIKDLSGLLFSALDADLTSRDYLRFLSGYSGRSWREGWSRRRLWRWYIVKRAVILYRSEHGRPPRLPAVFPSSS